MSYKIKIFGNQNSSEIPASAPKGASDNGIKIYLTTILPGLYFSVTDKLIDQHDERFLYVPPDQLNSDYAPDLFDDIVYKDFELLLSPIPFEGKIFVPIGVDNIVVGGLVCSEDHSDPSQFRCLLDDFSVSEYFSLIFGINDQLTAGDSIALQILGILASNTSFDAFMRAMSEWLVGFMGGGQASFYYRSGDDLILRKLSGQMSYYEDMPSVLDKASADRYKKAIAERHMFLPEGIVPTYVTELKSPPAVRFVLGGEIGGQNNYLLTGFVPNFTSYSFALFFARLRQILSGLDDRHFSACPDWNRLFPTLDRMILSDKAGQEIARFLYDALGESIHIGRLRLIRYNQLENRFDIVGDAGQKKHVYQIDGTPITVDHPDLNKVVETGEFLSRSGRIDSPAGAVYSSSKNNLKSEMLLAIKFENVPMGILAVGSPMAEEYLTQFAEIFQTVAGYLGNLFNRVECRKAIEVYARQEAEMHAKLAALENLRILGELAGGVLHDLNNIMGAIMGRSQLIMGRLGNISDSQLAARLSHDVELIEKATVDSGEILNRLRQLSRTKIETKHTIVSILEVVDDSIEMVRPHWERLSQEKGLKIVLKKDVPEEIKVLGEPAGLREVFTNLLLNAFDALPSGGEIGVSCRQVNGVVNIVVSDSGSGIPDDILGKVFDPFFTTKGEKGTGLGLSVSRKIIEMHSGNIIVRSDPEKGTKFMIEIPAYKKGNIEKASDSAGSNGGLLRILIVEDSEELKKMLGESLLSHGFEVSAASSGEEAIAICGGAVFDALIVDLGLPGMTGLDLAGQIRSVDRKIKIILISGWEIEQSVSDLQSRGIDSLITKPFKCETVLETLENFSCRRQGNE